MDKRTLKLTHGAMAVAIFGLMLFLNRQTGTLFEEFLLFVYPIPMVAYAALYGFGSGLPAVIAMILMSFFFGDFISIFYAISQALIGWVFGGCLYRKMDTTKVLLLVMLLSVIMNLVDLIFMSFLSGMDLNAQILEIQTMMNDMVSSIGIALPEGIFSSDYLRQMLIISMAIMGLLQGFVVYELSILILRRLRFPVPKLKNVFSYAPPRWTGIVALLALLLYSSGIAGLAGNEMAQQLALTLGMIGYMYLLFFGFLAAILTMKAYVTNSTILSAVVAVLLFVIFPFFLIILGLFYISTGFHSVLLEKMSARQKNR